MIKYSSKDDTWKHIHRVTYLLLRIQTEISKRIITHDRSKLKEPELSFFDKYTPFLRTTTYGSNEHSKFLEKLKPALDLHYAIHRHHPQFHKNGIDDMNLVDIIEMVCDWKAASERHNDGDPIESLKISKKRFGISPQLEAILYNTIKLLEQ